MLGALLLAPVLLLARHLGLAAARGRARPSAAGGRRRRSWRSACVAALALAMARHAARAAAARARGAAVPRADRGRRDDVEPARAAVRGRSRAGAVGVRAAAGCAAADGRRCAGAWAPGWLERLLALSVALYGIQATYSADFDKALQQIASSSCPFALLFVLLAQVEWTRAAAAPVPRRCSSGSRSSSAAIGCVEYATKHIFLNPKLIASNDLHTYFRTNSVFFDPNIYGRFLVVAMLGGGGDDAAARARARRVDRRARCSRRCGPGSC